MKEVKKGGAPTNSVPEIKEIPPPETETTVGAVQPNKFIKVSKVLLPHIALNCGLLVYLLIGAVVFQRIEQKTDDEFMQRKAERIMKQYNRAAEALQRLNPNINQQHPDWKQRVRFVVNSTYTDATAQLYQATIQLLHRILPVCDKHQTRFCTLMCDLLRTATVDGQLGIGASLQQLLLDTILDDQRVTLVLCVDKNGQRLAVDDTTYTNTLHPSLICASVLGELSVIRDVDAHITMVDALRDTLYTQKPNSAGSNKVTGKYAGIRVAFTKPFNVSVAQQPEADTNAEASSSSGTQIPTCMLYDKQGNSYYLCSMADSEGAASSVVVGTEWTPAAVMRHTLTHRQHIGTVVTLNLVAVNNNASAPSVSDTTNNQSTSIDTALHVFARMGGLSLLACHLQLVKPVLAVGGGAGAKRTTESHVHTAAMPTSSTAASQQVYNMYMADPYMFGLQDAGNMPIFGAGGAAFGDSAEYDFEFMDLASQVVGGIQPLVGGMQPSLHQHKSMNTTPATVTVLPNTGGMLPPYAVVAFSVFLRLPGYAELLVTHNRRRAQQLLRLAMGVTTDRYDVSTRSSDLSLLCFVCLDRLYENDVGFPVRIESNRLGVLDILLLCLAAFAHQTQHMNVSSATPVVRVVARLLRQFVIDTDVSRNRGLTTGTAASGTRAAGNLRYDRHQPSEQQYWAKGTGFGTGSTQQSNANNNANDLDVRRRRDEHNVAVLLKVLSSFLHRPDPTTTDTDDVHMSSPQSDTTTSSADGAPSKMQPQLFGEYTSLPVDLVESMRHSCVVTVLRTYLRNDSVLDISRHLNVYESALRLLIAMCQWPSLRALVCDTTTSADSLARVALKMDECVRQYLSKLNVGASQSAASTNTDDTNTNTTTQNRPASRKVTLDASWSRDLSNNAQTTTTETDEEGLLRLAPLLKRVVELLGQHVPDDKGNADRGLNANDINLNALVDEQYVIAMKPLQYETIPFWSSDSTMCVPYHYESSATASKQSLTGGVSARTRRLAQEAVSMSSSLPLNASSSVFVRAAEERLDVMKVLIIGPADTPYANGCFEFDVWFPLEYPQAPMHINLQTTGAHSVRFNPNLYNDGKVCLSVLNTWHGRPEERWNAQTSSFLQVLVSIQSLILVPEPYFNEPGYERSRSTVAGQAASREYDANIRQATVRWAMLEQLRRPTSVFADVIKRHFWLKKDEIDAQITEWCTDMQKSIDEHRAGRQSSQYLAALKQYHVALKEEFKKLTAPPGLVPNSTNSTDVSTEAKTTTETSPN